MIYLKWLAMVPVMLLVTALTFPLAFVLPFFATEQEGPLNNGNEYGLGPRLPKWLSWFQTPDNSLDGDNGWKTEHWQWRFRLPAPLCTYVNDSPGVEGYCLVHAGGLFQLVWVKRIGSSKCIYANLGWNIKGLINDPRNRYTATFAFSPRIATWKD